MRKPQRRETRTYKKSDLPRLRWTTELHQHFVQVVEGLGGKYKATPKRIVQMMSLKEMQISHVKSHLQMYRCMKDQTTKEVIKDLSNNSQENLPTRDICSLQSDKISHVEGVEHNERNQHEGQLNWEEMNHHIISTKPRENLFRNYTQDTNGSTISDVTKNEDDGEGFHSSVNHSTHIDLELTLRSACFSNSSTRCN